MSEVLVVCECDVEDDFPYPGNPVAVFDPTTNNVDAIREYLHEQYLLVKGTHYPQPEPSGFYDVRERKNDEGDTWYSVYSEFQCQWLWYGSYVVKRVKSFLKGE